MEEATDPQMPPCCVALVSFPKLYFSKQNKTEVDMGGIITELYHDIWMNAEEGSLQ